MGEKNIRMRQKKSNRTIKNKEMVQQNIRNRKNTNKEPDKKKRKNK